MIKVGPIVVKKTQHFLRAKSDLTVSLDHPVRMNIDALTMIGHAAHELTQRRRESIKPHLLKDYSTLCSSNVPETKFLFGDDLQTELTHIKETKNFSHLVLQSYPEDKQLCVCEVLQAVTWK